VSKLDDFVTEEVLARLDEARSRVAYITGKGTTSRQAAEVSRFYAEIRSIMATALCTHLDERTREYASTILKNAESVSPKIREALEGVIHQRLQAMESALQIASEGQKEQVAAYLTQMVALLRDFAANPEAVSKLPHDLPATAKTSLDVSDGPIDGHASETPVMVLQEQHYEIQDNSTGFTYERIFRPYIDTADMVTIEDPYIRLPYQVENLVRFCALVIRCGRVRQIILISGCQVGDDTDEADDRLEALRRDLNTRGVEFTWKREPTLHDREIRFDNGWTVKIGRGLDIYYKPENWISVEAADFSLRRCKQTKVDIYHLSSIARD
jgi:hypothetical protein